MIRVIVIDIRGFQVNDCLLWRGFYWVALQCQVILCTSNLRPSVLMEAVGTPNLQSLDHVGKDRGPVYIYTIWYPLYQSMLSYSHSSYICVYSFNLLQILSKHH